MHVLSWQFGHRGLFPDEVVEALSVEERELAWRETLASPSLRNAVFVADREGEVVGFVSCGPSRDPFPEPDAGEVYELFVHPGVVGTGVGVALLRKSLGHLRDEGFRTVMLWVLADNDRARRFYERLGLRPDASTKTARIGQAEAAEVRYHMSLEVPVGEHDQG